MDFSVYISILVLSFSLLGFVLHLFAKQFNTMARGEIEKSFNLMKNSVEELRELLQDEINKPGYEYSQEELSSMLQAEMQISEKENPETVKLQDGIEYEIVGGNYK